MRGAWQTPHGARPNREGMAATPCVPARRAQPPGRSLEPLSNGRPRGMIVAAATPYKIRLTGPASLVALSFQKNERAFQFCEGTEPCSFRTRSQSNEGLWVRWLKRAFRGFFTACSQAFALRSE